MLIFAGHVPEAGAEGGAGLPAAGKGLPGRDTRPAGKRYVSFLKKTRIPLQKDTYLFLTRYVSIFNDMRVYFGIGNKYLKTARRCRMNEMIV